jgi:hypothetical protein
MKEIETQNIIEAPINTVNVAKEIALEPIEEIKVPLLRDYKGRFVHGNQESVGNKGGRPRKLTRAELIENPEKLERIVERFENGDTEALIILLDLMEGKIK